MRLVQIDAILMKVSPGFCRKFRINFSDAPPTPSCGPFVPDEAALLDPQIAPLITFRRLSGTAGKFAAYLLSIGRRAPCIPCCRICDLRAAKCGRPQAM